MPAPASTISPARKRAAAANGGTASSGCSQRRTGAAASRDLLAPYLEVIGALNERGALDSLSRLARARARLAAAAGPADRLRARAARPPRAAPARCAATARIKTLAIDGWTALNGLCAAEGAARPGAGRSAVRADGRIPPAGRGACGRAPQMADRHLPALVPDQGAPRPEALAPSAAPPRRFRKSCAPN